MAPEHGLRGSIWARFSHLSRSHDNSLEATSRHQPPPPPPLPASRRRLPSPPSSSSTSPPPPLTCSSRRKPTTTQVATTTTATARVQSFQRFEQSCHRLRWKFIDLEASYGRAIAPRDWGFSAADAERNFKVDFYEFYSWIEQAIVFLLVVYGITVQRHAAGSGGGGSGPGMGLNLSSHAYHHNVLRALDDETNPLHGPLGTGDVNQALWKAKELRNRWKDAAEGRETPALKMYDLQWIVRQILGGLEAAYVLALGEVQGEMDKMETTDVQDGWEWMVEKMDLD